MKIPVCSESSKLFFIIILIFFISEIGLTQGIESPEKEVRQIDVVVDSYSFEPQEITVKVNTPVQLRLRSVTSVIPHNFSMSYPEAGLEIDEDVGSGSDKIIEFTPTKTGRYEFYCNKKSIFANHKKKGMVGTLVVE